ncbi:hypothetical protein SLEP1_g9528 [Rubroshorea leprosula]|uniref:Uncharacterized protein n=1 Tax=Rubroshorea leprosula TaxID=152421 RepID=A0AAV5IG72_9ROSI|nr:hypothetical protein SLEP1_g9528 [Rubroshorea leprosula]
MLLFQSDPKECVAWSSRNETEEQELENIGDEKQVNTRWSHEENEDDDVSSRRKEKSRRLPREARQEEQKPIEKVGNNLEQFENLIDVDKRVGVGMAEQTNEDLELSMWLLEEDGEVTGHKEKSNVQPSIKPIKQGERLEFEESTNVDVSIEIKDEDQFCKGYEDVRDRLQEWIRSKRNRGRGKQNMQPTEKKATSEFLLSPNGKIAEDSIDDSGIQNCNRSLKKKMQNQLAKETWDLAKQLGAVAEDEDDIIGRIEEMENRDTLAKTTMENQGVNG